MRKIIVSLIVMVACMALMVGCSSKESNTEADKEIVTFANGQTLTFTVENSAKATVTYQEETITTTTGQFWFGNNNDYPVEVYLLKKGSKGAPEMTLGVDSYSVTGIEGMDKDVPYEIGIQCGQEKGTEVKLLVSEKEDTE